MFVKYGGGKGGLKDYLETGKMQGRELTRRELDDRIVLDGDLDLCEKIYNSRDTEGEKYLHITLSFTEDENKLTPELLKQIVADYKQMAFGNGAYQDDELYMYAEAHIPRTKTESKWNAETKKYEDVPRLIHVHVVIPKTNLLTGQAAAPFGLLDKKFGEAHSTKDYTDAIKEHINEKYGLTSPNAPAHRREGFGGKADIISRIKADEFADRKAKNHDALKTIRDATLDNNIESDAAFRDMLQKMGYEIRTAKRGQPDEYLKIRKYGTEDQFIRLDHDQFRPEYLNLPMAEKLADYAARVQEKWDAEAPARKAARDELLATWGNRSRAEKYMSYGSKVHKAYLSASPEDKAAILEKLEAKFHDEPAPARVLSAESKGHEYLDALIKNPLNHEMSEEGKAEQIRLENYASAKLNKTYLRTSDQLAQAEQHGAEIIETPGIALKELTFNQSVFNETALQNYLLKNTANADQYDTAMRAVLAHPDLVVQHDKAGLQFTTAEIVAIEKRLVERADRMAGTLTPTREEIDADLADPAYQVEEARRDAIARRLPNTHLSKRALQAQETIDNLEQIQSIGEIQSIGDLESASKKAQLSPATVNRIAVNTPFNPGQRAAFELLCGNAALSVVNGAAGTGKSFVLKAMKDAYQAEGFKVYGAILQGKTAEDLERDSGIQSRTIARMLLDLDKGKLKLDTKSVVVVDEAGMVGSRDLEKLMAHVEAAGARLRLVGDAKQLAAVEYGNAFVEISKRCEVAALTEIMRQKTAWQIAASEKFAAHNIDGLRDYMRHGHCHITDTTKDAQIQIVKAWKQHRETRPDQSSIVVAHLNEERIALNLMMRAELLNAGMLTNEIDVVTHRGTLKIALGEKIMFTESDRKLGVKNGTSATVTGIENGIVACQLENGKIANIHADGTNTREDCNKIDYGYAITVHKSQGMTVDQAFVLGNSRMTLENLYVGMTRHKHGVEFYASAEDFQQSAQASGMGKLIAHGADNYNFDSKENKSYFATIQHADGSEVTLWGVDIERALEEGKAAIGETILLANQGKTEVTIQKEIRDEAGNVTGTESLLTHRNTWCVQHEPSEEEQKHAVQETIIRTINRAGKKSFSAENESADWLDKTRAADSPVGQLMAEINAEKVIQRAAHTAHHKEITQHLDPQRVLDYVSKEYGADLSKYEIVQDEKGQKAIQYDDKKHTVTEFLTRHMHLDYNEQAAPILKQCYAEQLQDTYSVGRYAPGESVDQSLRKEFAEHLKQRGEKYKADREAVSDRKREAVKAIEAEPDMAAVEKRIAKADIAKETATAKAALMAENNKSTKDVYKDFLAERAPTSERHLAELWRVSTTPADHESLAQIEIQRAKTGATEERRPPAESKHAIEELRPETPADRLDYDELQARGKTFIAVEREKNSRTSVRRTPDTPAPADQQPTPESPEQKKPKQPDHER